MSRGAFASVAAFERNNPERYRQMVRREHEIYRREDDVRTEFGRDYTRVLHSLAYRRLKHKAQVFCNAADNDHICTRIEHVSHVESVSCTIASYLGLNTELTKAIAMAHDLGHAPFGHQGERVLDRICQNELRSRFWHERHGLRLVDDVELLENNNGVYWNLNLTYAVRDGIISHCGELDQNTLRPREQVIDLMKEFTLPGMFDPFTWEGCVVKIADKIAYLGRDIEDATVLGVLDAASIKDLEDRTRSRGDDALNTSVIMHNMIIDVCTNSDLEHGITLSPQYSYKLNIIKNFNYDKIYRNKKMKPFDDYAELVIYEIYTALMDVYDGRETLDAIAEAKKDYPELMGTFGNYLSRYLTVSEADIESAGFKRPTLHNKPIYEDLSTRRLYVMAVVDYIAGMTDSYAIKVFNELLKY
ncbi:MAG: HD domain-containing protein [Lachnospiraceae bacterium]|nr:HD domain-containing protein [Lachnospiraceae bacterium]